MEGQKKPIWKRWWFWTIVILILIGIGSSGEDKDMGSGTVPTSATQATTTTPAPTPTPTQKATVPDLQVLDHSVKNEGYGMKSIVGTIKNNTNKKYGYVQIEINLYDSSGAQVGSTLDNLNNLEPNGTWKFSAAAFEDFSSYKIKDVSGF